MMELLLYDIGNSSKISNPMLKCCYHALIFLLQLLCFNNWWKILICLFATLLFSRNGLKDYSYQLTIILYLLYMTCRAEIPRGEKKKKGWILT